MTQQKERYFAAHWGQRVMIDVDNSGKEHNYPINKSNMYRIEESHLELTPLSQISDEDAIEIAKILIGEPFTRYRNIDVIRDFTVTGWPYIVIKHKQVRYKVQIDCNLVNFNIIDMDGDACTEFDMKPCECIDFLRDKSYAVPFADKSVEQLIDMGWLKLKGERHGNIWNS